MGEIENKVSKSALMQIDLIDYYPKGERTSIDISNQLWNGLVIKEKDFREYISSTDWSTYKDKFVAIHCTVDAIIPNWAFMLISSALQGISSRVVFGSIDNLESVLAKEGLSKICIEDYKDKPLIVKGCSELDIPCSYFVELVHVLQPVAKSIMFGEACSTVPVFKRKS